MPGGHVDEREQRLTDDSHTRARVIQQVCVIGGFQQSVDRDRNRSDFDRTEKADSKLWRIQQQQEDAFFDAHTKISESIAHLVNTLKELAIGDLNIPALNCYFCAATLCNVADDKMHGSIEFVRKYKGRHRGHSRSDASARDNLIQVFRLRPRLDQRCGTYSVDLRLADHAEAVGNTFARSSLTTHQGSSSKIACARCSARLLPRDCRG